MPVIGNTDVTLESLAAGARHRPAGGRRRTRLRRLLGLRRPRPRAAPPAPARPPLRHDGRPGDADGPAGGRRSARGCARRSPCAGRAPSRSVGLPWRAGWWRARWIGPSTSPPRWSCAGTRCASAPQRRRERSRDDLPLYATGAAMVLAALAARHRRGRRLPHLSADLDGHGTRSRSRSAARWSCSPPFRSCGARPVDPRDGEVALAWLKPSCRATRLSYRYPEARPRPSAASIFEWSPESSSSSPGRSGSGKSTPAARRLRPGAALPRRPDRGELVVAEMDVRSHGPAELAEAVGLVAQEPETQVVSTTVQAEIELPLELRGVSPGARSRAVEEVASHWRSTGCSSGPRTRSPAASFSASRSRQRSPPGRASSCSMSPPRSSTRSRGTS